MKHPQYTPPSLLFNHHIETIYPSLFRKVRVRDFEKERIDTPDDDFLDIGWLKNGSKNLVIISHGLEGNYDRHYVKGMAKAFSENGFDALGWSYRGCGVEMNRQRRFYHSGATDDLDVIVRHSSRQGYEKIFLIGFSLGGNLTLKYLGEQGSNINPIVKGAAVFSVPLNLHTSCIRISEPSNRIYARRFLKSLKKKIVDKSRLMNGIDIAGIEKIGTLAEFDDRYTAPLHGFKNAIRYYNACSAIHFLDTIAVPSLVVNAKNDPFLSADCFPVSSGNSLVELEYPQRGGHVGFALFNQNGLYWSELRALQFINALI